MMAFNITLADRIYLNWSPFSTVLSIFPNSVFHINCHHCYLFYHPGLWTLGHVFPYWNVLFVTASSWTHCQVLLLYFASCSCVVYKQIICMLGLSRSEIASCSSYGVILVSWDTILLFKLFRLCNFWFVPGPDGPRFKILPKFGLVRSGSVRSGFGPMHTPFTVKENSMWGASWSIYICFPFDNLGSEITPNFEHGHANLIVLQFKRYDK